MSRYLRVFYGLFRRGIMSALTWRGFLFTLVLMQTASPLLSWAIWSTALPSGATQPYYVMLIFTQLFVSSYEQHTTSASIYSGDFIDILVTPYPPLLNSFSSAMSLRFLHIAFSSPLIVVLFIWAWPSFAATALFSVPALLFAIVLRFLFSYCLAITALFTQRAFGITSLGDIAVMAFGGSAVSLLLPEFVQFARWLPFRYMLGFPAELAAGSLDDHAIIFGFSFCGIYLALFVLITLVVYSYGIRHYKGAES